MNPHKNSIGAAQRRTRGGPRTRKHILDVSLRLFSERGFARTTVRDIARDAGITDAAIYYHFTSKRDLLEALVEERGFIATLRELEHFSTDLPLGETLRRMARGAIRIMDENRDFLRLILMEGLSGDEAAIEQYQSLVARWEEGLCGVLRRHGDLGLRLRQPADLEVTARHIIYIILAAFVEGLLAHHIPLDSHSEVRQEALFGFVSTALDELLAGIQA